WVFVPAAGAVLADWGADVIKVEPPVTGDPLRGLTNAMSAGLPINPNVELPNRGKRSVGLDIASREGYEILLDLVDTADVFMTNFLPGVRSKLRIDIDHIQSRNPNVVYALGTAQGSVGPEHHR